MDLFPVNAVSRSRPYKRGHAIVTWIGNKRWPERLAATYRHGLRIIFRSTSWDDQAKLSEKMIVRLAQASEWVIIPPMAGLASIRWEDAFHAVIPQINADGLLSQTFDPLLPVQVRFYSYDRRRDFRSCRHNYFELFYLSSGNAVFRMGDQRLAVREGDMVLVNGLLYHNVELPKTGHDRALHGVLLYFLPDMFRGAMAARDDTEYLAPFLQQDDFFPHVIAAKTGVPEHIYALMREISTELPAQTVRARVIVKTYLKMILVKLLKHYSAYTGPVHSFARKHHSIERLDPLFCYLDAHYAEPLTLADAARVVGMSKSHFIHFMKQITGMSFVSYLNQFRVSKAQALMANTDKSLAQISHEVGFCDQSYFGQVFRKLLHTTPHRYQAQLEINERRTAGTGS